MIINTTIDSKRQRFGWLPIAMLSLALLFDFFAFMLQVAPSVMGQDLMHDVGFNAIGLSIISGCYFYAYAGMQIPVGILLDRFGPRFLMSIALMCCACGATLFAISHWVSVLGIAQILMGASAAFAYVSVLFIAIRWFPMAYFGILVGLTELIGSIGAMFGQAPLMRTINYFGWRQTMFGFAVMALVLSALVLLIVRDRQVSVQLLDDNQNPVLPKNNVWQQLSQVLHNRQLWIIGCCALLIWAPAITFGSLWGIPFMEARFGWSSTQASDIATFLWLGTAVGAPTIGWLATKMQHRQTPLVIYSLVGLVASLVLFYVPNLSTGLVALLLFGFGFACAGTCLTFALVQDRCPQQLVGTAMGFNNMMVVIGGPISQLIVGLVLQSVWHGSNSDSAATYTAGEYQLALAIIPLCFIAAAVIAQFCLRASQTQYTDKKASNDELANVKHVA